MGFLDFVVVLVTIAGVAELNRLGGKGGFTHARTIYRKIGIGVLLGISGLLLGAAWWQSLLVVAANFGATSLPLTLIGDDINEHWFNKPWVFIAGFVNGLIPAVFGFFDHLAFAFVAAIIYGGIYGGIQIASLKQDGLADRINGGSLGLLSCLINLL